MSLIKDYPQYAPIEAHIRRAGIERSVYVSHAIVDLLLAAGRLVKRIARALEPDNDQLVRIFPRTESFVRGFAPHR